MLLLVSLFKWSKELSLMQVSTRAWLKRQALHVLQRMTSHSWQPVEDA